MAEDGKKQDNFAMLADIHREVGETRTKVEGMETTLGDHIKHTRNELSKINELDAEQNRILDKHIEGVNTLKEMHVAHRNETKKQIESLEESIKLQREALGVQKAELVARLVEIEKPVLSAKAVGKAALWTIATLIAIAGLLVKLGVL